MQKNQRSKSRDKMIKKFLENMTEKSTSQSTNLQVDMTDWTADHPTTDQRMDMIGKKVTL